MKQILSIDEPTVVLLLSPKRWHASMLFLFTLMFTWTRRLISLSSKYSLLIGWGIPFSSVLFRLLYWSALFISTSLFISLIGGLDFLAFWHGSVTMKYRSLNSEWSHLYCFLNISLENMAVIAWFSLLIAWVFIIFNFKNFFIHHFNTVMRPL